MNKLITSINQIQPLSPKEELKVFNTFKSTSLKKNDLWLKEGKICNEIAFVNSGRLRIFYIDENGNDITCYLMPENNFISSFTSFLTLTPSFENIVAIEDSELLVAGREAIEQLSAEVPKIQILRRVIAENLFITLEKRISMLQSKSANERYEKMMKEHPETLLNVPLQYTASFLGITPQHLSRLRKNSKK